MDDVFLYLIALAAVGSFLGLVYNLLVGVFKLIDWLRGEQ